MKLKKIFTLCICVILTFSIYYPSQAVAVDSRAKLSIEKIIAKYDSSVVVIEGYDLGNESLGFGSGFYIGNGLFLTNYHVMNIEGVKSYKIYTNNDKSYDVEGIVKYDKARDLAIIKTKKVLALPIVKTCSFSKVQKGEKIIAIGNPEGLQNSVSEGIVSSKRTVTTNKLKTSLIQITASITFGSSGGPVFNMYGEVVGLSTFGLEGQGNLNFAVSVDHALPWVNELKKLSFVKIKTIKLPSTTAIAGNQNNSNSTNTNTNTNTTTSTSTKPSSFLNGFEIAANASDAIINPEKNLLYVTDMEKKTLYMIDYDSKKTTSLSFQDKPESLFLDGDKLYVALVKKGHAYYDATADTGEIAVVDASTLKLIEQFDIEIDPFDIIVGRDGYLYITGGSNQWTTIRCYSLKSKQECAKTNIRMQSYAELHPIFDRIYTINTDVSPRDYNAYNIENGTFKTPGYDSPYHGDYNLNKSFRISPDGKFLFNSSGTIFSCSVNKADDMKYAGKLNSEYQDIAFNLKKDIFFISRKGGKIYSYAYSNLEGLKTYSMNGEPFKLFYKADALIAITKIGEKFGVEKLSLQNDEAYQNRIEK